jgi:hypothetical protein
MVVTTTSTTPLTGDYDCTAATNLLEGQGVYASGIGTPDFALPSGVAVHIGAGEFLTLNAHVRNGGTQDLTGVSSVLVSTTTANHVANQAELAFGGTLNISIPADGITHTATGGCNAPADHHIVALWPHLQAIGTNVSVVVTDAGVPRTVLNMPYSLDDQVISDLVPSQFIRSGDQIQATCSYVNNTSQTVHFGDSTNDEECFVGMYRYPPLAGTSMLSCVN